MLSHTAVLWPALCNSDDGEIFIFYENFTVQVLWSQVSPTALHIIVIIRHAFSTPPPPLIPKRLILVRLEMIWLRAVIRWGFGMRARIGKGGQDHK